MNLFPRLIVIYYTGFILGAWTQWFHPTWWWVVGLVVMIMGFAVVDFLIERSIEKHIR